MEEETNYPPMKLVLTPCCAICQNCKWSTTMATHYCSADGLEKGKMSIDAIYQEHVQDCRKRAKYAQQPLNPHQDRGEPSIDEIGPIVAATVRRSDRVGSIIHGFDAPEEILWLFV